MVAEQIVVVAAAGIAFYGIVHNRNLLIVFLSVFYSRSENAFSIEVLRILPSWMIFKAFFFVISEDSSMITLNNMVRLLDARRTLPPISSGQEVPVKSR